MFSTMDLGQCLRVVAALGLLGICYYAFWRLLGRIFARLQANGKKRRGLRFFLAIILATAVILAGANFYVYHGFGHQPDIARRGNPASNMVAITFDDGPSPEFTPAILDILKEKQVVATFFLVGAHVEQYPEIAVRIVEEGHEIGNHTLTHRNIPTLSALGLQQEVVEATKVITDITGQYPDYFRPPRGLYDGRLRRLTALIGQQIVLWSLSSRDWRYPVSAEAITSRVLSRVQGGDIILFHDSGALIRSEGADRSATVKALTDVIDGIRAQGLEVVPLRELLAGDEPADEASKLDMLE